MLGVLDHICLRKCSDGGLLGDGIPFHGEVLLDQETALLIHIVPQNWKLLLSLIYLYASLIACCFLLRLVIKLRYWNEPVRLLRCFKRAHISRLDQICVKLPLMNVHRILHFLLLTHIWTIHGDPSP